MWHQRGSSLSCVCRWARGPKLTTACIKRAAATKLKRVRRTARSITGRVAAAAAASSKEDVASAETIVVILGNCLRRLTARRLAFRLVGTIHGQHQAGSPSATSLTKKERRSLVGPGAGRNSSSTGGRLDLRVTSRTGCPKRRCLVASSRPLPMTPSQGLSRSFLVAFLLGKAFIHTTTGTGERPARTETHRARN